MAASRPQASIALGTANSSQVVANLHEPGNGSNPWAQVKVQLSAAYQIVQPPGYPPRPPAGVAAKSISTAGVINNGTTVTLFAHEAAALVAAGAAIYV